MITVKKIKDPDATLDYLFRWTDELNAVDDTIVSHTVIVDTGITLVSSSHTDTEVRAWISGGTIDTRYLVTCRIVTVAGRTYDKSFYLYIDQV